MRTYYVYTLAYPDGTVFYVGKGFGSRVNHHETQAGRFTKKPEKNVNAHKCRVIQQIWDEGGQVVKKIVFETENELSALIYEWGLMYIVYSTDKLTNSQHYHPGPMPAEYYQQHQQQHTWQVFAKNAEGYRMWKDNTVRGTLSTRRTK